MHHFEDIGLGGRRPPLALPAPLPFTGGRGAARPGPGVAHRLSEPDVVVPIEAGPFRLQSSPDRFGPGGLDREGLLDALERGLDVLSAES